MNILIVEDDLSLCEGVAIALKAENTNILKAYNIKSARELIKNNFIELIILDINLPDGSGLDLLRELKDRREVQVILLTAKDTESDIVLGLDCGADDYITKPFSLAVLRAKVGGRLRKKITSNMFVQGDYSFDFEGMEFFIKGRKIELSKTEQRLLRLLTANRGRTLVREELLDRIWSDGGDFVNENALSVTVKRLRTRLESEEVIKTIYGLGYQWVGDNV